MITKGLVVLNLAGMLLIKYHTIRKDNNEQINLEKKPEIICILGA